MWGNELTIVDVFHWGEHWPLGINPSMDTHAADGGFSHWSCTEPSSNTAWIRRDGEQCFPTFNYPNGYFGDLERIDKNIPIRC